MYTVTLANLIFVFTIYGQQCVKTLYIKRVLTKFSLMHFILQGKASQGYN